MLSVLCLCPGCLLSELDTSYEETLFSIAYTLLNFVTVWDESLFSRHLFSAVCSGRDQLSSSV